MGGSVAIESALDQGSCFTLTLPRATRATDEALIRDTAPPAHRQLSASR